METVPTVAVKKTFRAFVPDQMLMLPPSLDEWLPEGHLARFVAELVDEVLDLGRSWRPTPRSAGSCRTTRG
ncbi:hypothetical protein QF030_008060 [Streptomyces rishiriensis]|uniref:Transposase n=1 Tax=Streptomyces rishiriensis TaxID=68264 RepID=A0ABU0P4W2_STRRH|nr:hypothetical protein [Streptomyces rishiriensis]